MLQLPSVVAGVAVLLAGVVVDGEGLRKEGVGGSTAPRGAEGWPNEGVGVATAPSGAGWTKLLLEPAWYASTPPISRPSTTGTASWAATGTKPLLCLRYRPADRRPLYIRSTSTSAVLPQGEKSRTASWHDAGNLEGQILQTYNVAGRAGDREVTAGNAPPYPAAGNTCCNSFSIGIWRLPVGHWLPLRGPDPLRPGKLVRLG